MEDERHPQECDCPNCLWSEANGQNRPRVRSKKMKAPPETPPETEDEMLAREAREVLRKLGIHPATGLHERIVIEALAAMRRSSPLAVAIENERKRLVQKVKGRADQVLAEARFAADRGGPDAGPRFQLSEDLRSLADALLKDED